MNGITTSLLTISLTTYNRPEKIKEQILVLLPQLNKEVKLIVRDNCSNQNVSLLFTEDQLSNFEIVRTIINIGGDANIARGFENCDTKWLWTLSDDDIVNENAVAKVCELIKKYDEAIYINLDARVNRTTTGFEDFANIFTIRGAFGNAFFMSNCLYNMNILKPSLIHYYRHISCMIGTFIMILKHLEQNSNGKCVFIKERIIDDQSLDIAWNRSDIIIYSSLIFESFKHKRKFLNKNVFKSVGMSYYYTIFFEINSSVNEKLYLLRFAISRVGIINTLMYNKVTLIDILIKKLLPRKLYIKIKSICLKFYLNRIN